MKIYLVRQRSQIISGYELNYMPHYIFGAYEDKQEAKNKAKKVVETFLKRKYECKYGDSNFDKTDYAQLYKGDGYSEIREHIIQIVPIKVKEKEKVVNL